MCARFTVLSDAPIAAAIAGCVIPLSRNSTIWMRWRCAAGIFHRSAVFSPCPESDGESESHLGRGKQFAKQFTPLTYQELSIQAVLEVVLEPANCTR
jgi:hypothetical protein